MSLARQGWFQSQRPPLHADKAHQPASLEQQEQLVQQQHTRHLPPRHWQAWARCLHQVQGMHPSREHILSWAVPQRLLVMLTHLGRWPSAARLCIACMVPLTWQQQRNTSTSISTLRGASQRSQTQVASLLRRQRLPLRRSCCRSWLPQSSPSCGRYRASLHPHLPATLLPSERTQRPCLTV